MFADLSSGTGNTAETWHQLHQVSQTFLGMVIGVHGSQRGIPGRAQLSRLIPGCQGRASGSDDAPRRNAAAAARLSSIRQS